MDLDFWNERWKKDEIAFHMEEINPMLIKNIDKLSLPKNATIFIPLCGKTLDIKWLLSKNYKVVGIELNNKAVEMLFQDLGVKPTILIMNNFALYSSKNLDIYVGDFFDLSNELTTDIDAIYDRAALVALPKDMRHSYVEHLLKITNNSSQLLLSYEYEKNIKKGPPFCVEKTEIKKHYEKEYEVVLLEENLNIPSGLKRKFEAIETIWLLKKLKK